MQRERKMKLNKHYSELNESYLFSTIAHKVAAYQKANPDKDIIRLGIGDVTLPLAKSVTDAMLKAVEEQGKKETFHGYIPSEQGYEFLRSAIQKYYAGHGVELDMAEIFVSDGAKSDLGNLLDLFSQDNTILVPDPVYPVYVDTNLMAGRRIVMLNCTAENGFTPMPDEGQEADLIYLCSPNNPTGAVYSKEVLLAIAEIARQHHLVILADEIYDRLVMDGLRHESIGALAPDLPCVTFNGLSKSHIICGFRCGWMVFSGPKGELDAVKDGVMQLASMRLCGNALTQLVIPAALVDSESTHEMLVPGGRLFEQRKATLEALDKIDGVDYVTNHAAFYLFPRLDKSRFDFEDAHDFAMKFLHEQHVLVIPGGGFDWHEDLRFRIVMLPEPETLTKAMSDMAYFLKQHRI